MGTIHSMVNIILYNVRVLCFLTEFRGFIVAIFRVFQMNLKYVAIGEQAALESGARLDVDSVVVNLQILILGRDLDGEMDKDLQGFIQSGHISLRPPGTPWRDFLLYLQTARSLFVPNVHDASPRYPLPALLVPGHLIPEVEEWKEQCDLSRHSNEWVLRPKYPSPPPDGDTSVTMQTDWRIASRNRRRPKM
jgi:hypothetical protein